MATFNKGILGGFSGKVGNVVGAHWRGLNIMRSVPPRRGPGGTPEQLMQRRKFTTVVQFLQPIRAFLNRYYGENQGVKSRFNLATAYHLQFAVDYVDPDFEMRYNRVMVSKGDLPGAEGLTVSPMAGQVLAVSWTDNSSQSQAQSTDALLVVVFCPVLNLFTVFDNVAERSDTSVQLTLNQVLQNEEVYIWVGFTSPALKKSATSVYAGSVTIL